MFKYIKIILIRIIGTLLILFSYLVPVSSKRVFLCSFGGKSFSCNPYYIAKGLVGKDVDIIAVVNDKYFHRMENVRYVISGSILYYYYFFSSRVLITNDSFPSFLPVKNNQFVINTWHGGGAYKKVTAKDDYTKKYYQIIYSRFDKFISSSSKFTDVMSQDLFIDKNKFLNIGMPRNDIFFSVEGVNKINDRVRKNLKINVSDLVVLYAPTWRDDNRDIIHNLIGSEVEETFKKKFGKKVRFLLRAHYHTNNKLTGSENSIDVTNYPDMQELLCTADVLVTDYSSCMWDFSLMFKPCFIYATDIKQYRIERNFYTDINQWPFPLAEDNQELINNINDFDENRYIDDIRKHHKNLGSFEDGHATENVCNLIEVICSGKVK